MPKGYETVSLPTDLLEQVRALIKAHPELGYSSLADFIKAGIRANLEHEKRSLAIQRELEGKPEGAVDREILLGALDIATRTIPSSAQAVREALEKTRRVAASLPIASFKKPGKRPRTHEPR